MAKHKWQKLSNGNINDFAYSFGYCNGPMCVECGYYFCEHCKPEGYDSECPGRRGFRVYLDIKSYKMLGFRWGNKKFIIGFWFINIIFDFNGLFPACAEVEDD